MNAYDTDTNAMLIDATPLFASVWLALFYILRKNFNERRLTKPDREDKLQPIKKA